MIIVDYNVGNIGSIVNMLKKIGVKAKLSSDERDILSADKLLLPGVGSFEYGMSNLKQSGLLDSLNQRVLIDKTPILGICLGMQLLMESSEEGGGTGLGWIKGSAKRFNFDKSESKFKVPHMGWNIVNPTSDKTLFKRFDDETRFYFVHSYHVECDEQQDVLSYSPYGGKFVSSIAKENIFGVQFHPEKSHRYGMQLLKNFAELN